MLGGGLQYQVTGSDERLPIGHNLHRSFAIDTMPHDTIEEEVANLRLIRFVLLWLVITAVEGMHGLTMD